MAAIVRNVFSESPQIVYYLITQVAAPLDQHVIIIDDASFQVCMPTLHQCKTTFSRKDPRPGPKTVDLSCPQDGMQTHWEVEKVAALIDRHANSTQPDMVSNAHVVSQASSNSSIPSFNEATRDEPRV